MECVLYWSCLYSVSENYRHAGLVNHFPFIQHATYRERRYHHEGTSYWQSDPYLQAWPLLPFHYEVSQSTSIQESNEHTHLHTLICQCSRTSLTFSSTILQWRSKALTRANNLWLLRQLIKIWLLFLTDCCKTESGPVLNSSSSCWRSSSSVISDLGLLAIELHWEEQGLVSKFGAFYHQIYDWDWSICIPHFVVCIIKKTCWFL